jgi:hypothetical protein
LQVAVLVNDDDDPVQFFLRWHALIPTDLDRTVFVHFLDGEGAIVAQQDHPQAPAVAHMEAGAEWVDIVSVPRRAFNRAITRGLGVYDPAAPDRFVPVCEGASDWGDRRLLIRLR